jgi:N-acetylneuraminic acid mutarotase
MAAASALLGAACTTPSPYAGAAWSDAGPLPVADAGDGGSFIWTEVTPCPLARFEANGAVVGAELWVLGGFISRGLDVTTQVDIYNPATDSWRAGPALPGAQTHFGAAVVGEDLIVVGGFFGNIVTETGDVWRWTAADGAWHPGPALPAPQAAFASALMGNLLHVASGLGPDKQTDTGTHLVWDVTTAGPWTPAAPLPNPRNHGGGAATGGRFYAVAGRHRWDENAGDDLEVHAYDPAADAWTARAPIPLARSEIGGATSTMSDGRILVVGGSLSGVIPSDDVLIYDPTADAWSRLPPLPGPRKGTVAARIGDRIVVTTGSPTSTDPAANTWIGCCF